MPKISVIVPVYNVENYLKQCLDSILSQTFTDIEIICVNDGSSDNSRKIIEEYSDNRIKIIDKENGGLSSARNSGLKVAEGEFISFIDSDDWIAPDFLEKLYKNITAHNSDISICAVHLFDEKTQKLNDDEKYFNLSFFDETYDNTSFSYEKTQNFIMDIPVMAWNKLYRHSFLKNCKASFPEGLIFEDGAFFFKLYFSGAKTSIVRDLLYYYRRNREGSILQNGGEHIVDILDIINLMYYELKKSSIYENVKYEFYKRKIEEITYRYSFLKGKNRRKYRNKVNKSLCLSNKKEFDYKYILNNLPEVLYKNFCYMRGFNGILEFKFQKFIMRLRNKIMQVINTDKSIFYIKLWSLKLRIKKIPEIFNMWYEDDKINVVLFNKIKYSFLFDYSKQECKK